MAHCISKVHVELRKVKPECYKPLAVSIGPYYHKCDPGLEAMQQLKQQYLNSLLERRAKSSQRRNKRLESRENYLSELTKLCRENYRSELAELETKARECYADPMSKMNADEFTEMMLLDSCFVVEFIRKMNYVPSDENDPIPDDEKAAFDIVDPIGTVQSKLNQIQRDMILLENQLPYFVLSKFYDMTKYDGEKSLEKMAMSCFNASLPRPRQYFINCKGEKIDHLLHLVHIFCRPSPKEKICSSDESTSAQRHDSSEKRPEDSVEDSVGSINENNHIRTVVELQEAGVKFKKDGKVYSGRLMEGTGNAYVSLFDIEFKREVMKFPCFKVPCFKVEDSTETLLRNLIAYEQQYFIGVEPKYFTDFAMLMNQLINSEKDTKVLRYQDIIINFLGDDKDVSQLFNSLIVGVCDSLKSYFFEVRKNVDKHCKTKWKIRLAYVKRNYCYNPCVTASTIAAIILLILTVLQFMIALLTWLDTI